MKNIIYTLLISFVTQQLSAQSQLTFFTEEGENFTLYVNGKQAYNTPQSRVTATANTSDFAQIKIKFDASGAPELKKNMMIEANMHTTSIIKKNKKGRYIFRGVSSVPVEDNIQTIRVTEVSQASDNITTESNTSTVETTLTNSSSNSASIGVNISANNTGLNLNVNVNDQFTEIEEQPVETYESSPPPAQPTQPVGPDC